MSASKQDAGAALQAAIQADRKKRNQELAQEMFGKKSGSGVNAGHRNKVTSGPGAALAARIGGGVTKKPPTKRSLSVATTRPSIDGQWSHDLHNPRNAGPRGAMNRTSSASRLDRGSRLANNLQREVAVSRGRELFAGASNASSNVGNSSMYIRGMAHQGPPYIVIASNFAPGTTAADVEAAVGPIGGGVTSCRLLSPSPTVMIEIGFESLEGAENVIDTFNNQKADGRVLYVYRKNSSRPAPTFETQSDRRGASIRGSGRLQPLGESDDHYNDQHSTSQQPVGEPYYDSRPSQPRRNVNETGSSAFSSVQYHQAPASAPLPSSNTTQPANNANTDFAPQDVEDSAMMDVDAAPVDNRSNNNARPQGPRGGDDYRDSYDRRDRNGGSGYGYNRYDNRGSNYPRRGRFDNSRGGNYAGRR